MYYQRWAARIIQVFIVIVGWIVIAFGSIYETNIQEFFRINLAKFSPKFALFIGEWSATLIMTLVNYLIPWIIGFTQSLEKWDFAEEELKADLIKNYYTAAFNIVIFMAIQVNKNLNVENLNTLDQDYECKEDELADSFLKLIISEVVLRYAYYVFWLIYHKIKSSTVPDYDFEQDFELSDELVWFLAMEIVLMSTIVIYPIMSVVNCILMYVHCKYLIYRLKY